MHGATSKGRRLFHRGNRPRRTRQRHRLRAHAGTSSKRLEIPRLLRLPSGLHRLQLVPHRLGNLVVRERGAMHAGDFHVPHGLLDELLRSWLRRVGAALAPGQHALAEGAAIRLEAVARLLIERAVLGADLLLQIQPHPRRAVPVVLAGQLLRLALRINVPLERRRKVWVRFRELAELVQRRRLGWRRFPRLRAVAGDDAVRKPADGVGVGKVVPVGKITPQTLRGRSIRALGHARRCRHPARRKRSGRFHRARQRHVRLPASLAQRLVLELHRRALVVNRLQRLARARKVLGRRGRSSRGGLRDCCRFRSRPTSKDGLCLWRHLGNRLLFAKDRGGFRGHSAIYGIPKDRAGGRI